MWREQVEAAGSGHRHRGLGRDGADRLRRLRRRRQGRRQQQAHGLDDGRGRRRADRRSSTASRPSSSRSTPTPTWWCSTSPGSRRRRSSRRRSPAVRARTSPSWATPRPRAGPRRRPSPTSPAVQRLGRGQGHPARPGARTPSSTASSTACRGTPACAAIYYRTDWFAEAGVQAAEELGRAGLRRQGRAGQEAGHLRHRPARQLRAAVLLLPLGRRRARSPPSRATPGSPATTRPRRRRRSSSGPTW